MDPFFKEIILKWTIKKTMIVLPNIRPNKNFSIQSKNHSELIDIFETFGNSISKLRVDVSSVKFLLELIMLYCAPATLTDLDLGKACFYETPKVKRLKVSPTDDSILLYRSMPFLSNLRTFTIRTFEVDENVEKRMDILITKTLICARALRKVEIDCHNKDGWLKYVKNLYELRIGNAESLSEHLISSLTVNPKLKVFAVSYSHNTFINPIGVALSKFCPDLEYFSDLQSPSPYKHFHSIIDRYNFLSTMTNLNHVGLTSFTKCCCDLYYPLKSLANMNITHLEIFLSFTNIPNLSEDVIAGIMQATLPNFNNLHTLYVRSCTAFTPNCRFIFHLVKRLTNLKICGMPNVSNVHHILENAPSIQTLEYSPYFLENNKKIASDIVEALRKIRRSNNEQHLLNLRLYPYWRSNVLKLFKNTEDVLKISFNY